jgi:hypothetical protein
VVIVCKGKDAKVNFNFQILSFDAITFWFNRETKF